MNFLYLAGGFKVFLLLLNFCTARYFHGGLFLLSWPPSIVYQFDTSGSSLLPQGAFLFVYCKDIVT